MSSDESKHSRPPAGEAWQEVGRQFKQLGESLASAFKTTWQNPETRQHLKNMQAELEAMVEQLRNAVGDVTSAAEARKVKIEVEMAAHSAKTAGQEVSDEVRAQLLAAFRKLRAELDELINDLDKNDNPPSRA